MKSTRYPNRERTDLTDTVITVDGVDYRLTKDAYMANNGCEAAYEAVAIRTDEQPDEDGYQPTYRILWAILSGWDGEDEAEACAWDEPCSIEEYDLALME